MPQVPDAGAQLAVAWLAVQATGLPPVQTPAWQVSVWVQASPSSQAVPSGAAGLVHAPVAGSQVPAVWHWSRAAQATAAGVVPQVPPAQAAARHLLVGRGQSASVPHWQTRR